MVSDEDRSVEFAKGLAHGIRDLSQAGIDPCGIHYYGHQVVTALGGFGDQGQGFCHGPGIASCFEGCKFLYLALAQSRVDLEEVYGLFFLDGEEEAGSRHLGEYMERWKDLIDDIDIWLFFDGPAHPSGRPQIVFGVRGSMGMEVTVYGATRNLHSGHYGNWTPDTGNILARLLTSMKDDSGRVLVDGWYDTVEPIGDEERAALEGMPAWDEELKRELGLVRTEVEPETLPERLMVPALNVRGITSGNTGALARNVIPNTAVAALGIRLVKGNEPAHMRELVIDHIRGQGFHVVNEDPDMETRLRYPRIAKVTGGGGSIAARTSMANPFAQNIMGAASAAADRAFGPGSLVIAPGMGGTLPLSLFTEIAQKPAIIVPVANHDNNQHAPDENLRIANLWYAIDLYGALLSMPETVF